MRGVAGAGRMLRIVMLCAGLAACGGAGMPIPDVEMRPPPDIPLGRSLATIEYGGVTYAIPPGTTIGGYGGSWFSCAQRGDPISWLYSRTEAFSRDFEDAFFRRMRLAGYNTVGDPNNLFKAIERGQPRTDYLVAGRIEDIRLDLCVQRNLLTGDEKYLKTGRGYILVEWQVFSQSLKKVVYTTRTEGVARLDDPSMMAAQLLVNNAFASSVSNLAAEAAFLDIVSRDATLYAIADRETRPAPLLVPEVPLFDAPLADHAPEVRRAVATIDNGLSHGSGVYITPSLLLTNYHVVEGRDTVLVRDLGGDWQRGEVLRRDRRRDVALVQTTSGGHPFLPIRMDPLRLTEDVFAIGTPRLRGLAGTVTRGAVSGFPRNDDGLPDIQADVAVNPGNSGGALVDGRGNLVGLTYAGFATADGGRTGLNLFIPIASALETLNLSVEVPPPAVSDPWESYPEPQRGG